MDVSRHTTVFDVFGVLYGGRGRRRPKGAPGMLCVVTMDCSNAATLVLAMCATTFTELLGIPYEGCKTSGGNCHVLDRGRESQGCNTARSSMLERDGKPKRG